MGWSASLCRGYCVASAATSNGPGCLALSVHQLAHGSPHPWWEPARVVEMPVTPARAGATVPHAHAQPRRKFMITS